MKIVLSPSKTQNLEPFVSKMDLEILNKEKTLSLFERIKGLSKCQMMQIMHLKGNLLDETHRLYQAFSPENSRVRAIDCYDGMVFQQIKWKTYNETQRTYLFRHVAILSAMYGVLEPETAIWPYRLDMTMRNLGVNLYDFWQESIHTYFQKEDKIIHLASGEFGRLLKPCKEKIVQIQFYERKQDGGLKISSVQAKKARGEMANQLVLLQLNDVEQIKDIRVDGYAFKQALSSPFEYVFVREMD